MVEITKTEHNKEKRIKSNENSYQTTELTSELREGQGIPVCGSPWGRKKSDTTEQLNKKMGQH